ncbi:MAG TPA: hypothetical protein DDZ51_17605 [Planctomycetaceae bacterium]|nr:hypothetical protein [Planctomycetaceae bacterium]
MSIKQDRSSRVDHGVDAIDAAGFGGGQIDCRIGTGWIASLVPLVVGKREGFRFCLRADIQRDAERVEFDDIVREHAIRGVDNCLAGILVQYPAEVDHGSH